MTTARSGGDSHGRSEVPRDVPRNADADGDDRGPTGAGAEAAEGTLAAGGDRAPSDRSGVDAAPNAGEADRPGSEPLTGRKTQHVSGYGGKGGEPRESSDQR